jgi:hypothetical protein
VSPEKRGLRRQAAADEEQANAVSAELPPGLAKTRLLHIVVLAQTLRVRLEFGRLAW